MKYLGHALAYVAYWLDMLQTNLCGHVTGYNAKTTELYGRLSLRTEIKLYEYAQEGVDE